MVIRTTIQSFWLFVAAFLAVMVLLTAHASLNRWQWGLFERTRAIEANGTQGASDLSLYMIDRQSVWEWPGSIGKGTHSYFKSKLEDVPEQYLGSGAIVFPTQWMDWPHVLQILVLAIAMSGVGILGLVLGFACGLRRRNGGLPGLWLTSEEGRTALVAALLSRFQKRVSISAAILLGCAPVLATFAWYIWFDRGQRFAFVGSTFVPERAEWVTYFGAVFAMTAVVAYIRTPLWIRDVRQGVFAKKSPCTHCGYVVDVLGAVRCPECGRMSAEVDANMQSGHVVAIAAKRLVLGGVALSRKWSWGGLAVVAGLGLIAGMGEKPSVPPAWMLRRMWTWPEPVTRAINWLAIRGETCEWRPHGTYSHGEIVRVVCDNHVLRFVTFAVDLPDPISSPVDLPASSSIRDSTPAISSTSNFGIAIAWSEEPLVQYDNETDHRKPLSPQIIVVGVNDADYANRCEIVTAEGWSLRSPFTVGGENNLVRFTLSRTVSDFSRVSIVGCSDPACDALLEPLLDEIAARNARVLDRALLRGRERPMGLAQSRSE